MDVGDIVLGRFVIEANVASGAMGVIHRAHDRETGMPVAVKSLRGGTRAARIRFRREAQVLATLDHPRIVRYIAYADNAAGDPAIVMEWVEGKDLARVLRNRMPVEDVLGIVKQLASALAHVHRTNIVHRDVKPGNVVLENGDPARAKLVDFGLAKPMTGDDEGAGFMVGTPQYMAPEQVRGEVDLDARTDLFALGCFAFKCLAGRGPFQAPDARGVLTRVLFDDPTPLTEVRPDLSPQLESLVMWMLEKDRARRPASGDEVASAIEAIRGERVIVPAHLPALTEREQRLVCFVLVAEHDVEIDLEAEATIRLPRGLADDAHAREMAELHGARLEVLADGSLAAAITGDGSAATDQVARAARLALALAKNASEGASVVLATGRAELGMRPVGTGIDRAMDLLHFARAPHGKVRIDDVTAGLLDPSFEVDSHDGELVLAGERKGESRVRTLLGRPTPCVGRDAELAAIDRVFAECRAQNRARSILVTADAGVGKSRLRHEWTRTVAAPVLGARGDPMAIASPLGLIAELVRSFAGIRRGEPARAIRARIRARVRNERTSLFLAELVGAGDPDETDLAVRAARLDPHIMSDQLESAWSDLLSAQHEAVALVVEDLHWCDEGSLRFLENAMTLERPIFVFALARPDPRLARIFPFEIALRPLSSDAARMLAESFLEPADVAEIVEHAAGNAFFLEELIRARAEGRRELPETVLAMLLARFERLTPHGRRVLRAASVVGPMFWRGAVDAMLGESESAPRLADDDALDELVRAELITKRRSHIAQEEEWSFRHATVREAAYGMLTDRDRVLGHALVAGWLETRAINDAALVAEHYERGEKPMRALPWWHRAAVQAMEAGDLAAAIVHVHRAMECGASGEMLGALHLLEAAAERWVGRYKEARDAARHALRAFSGGSDHWYESLGELVIGASSLGDVETVLGARDAFLAQPSRWTPTRVMALAQIGGSLLLIRPELAKPLLDLSKEIDTRVLADHPLAVAYLERLRGLDAMTSGNPASLYRSMKAACEAFHSAGDRRNATVHAANAGFAASQMGAAADAERMLQYALQQARGLGILSLAKKNLARLRFVQGDHETAARDAVIAAEELAGYGHARLESYARAYASQAELAAGRAERAIEQGLRAIDCAAAFPGARSNAWAALSRAKLAAGDPEGALEAALEAKRLFDDLGALEDGETLVRVAHAEALFAAGRENEAKEALIVALERIEQAGRDVEPQWQEGYRHIPEIVWTADLAKRLGLAVALR